MIIKKTFTILLFINSLFFAQAVKVIETVKIPIAIISEANYPRFTKDDSKIIFSSANYNGLYSFDLKSKSSSVISNLNGAGYNPLIMDDGTVLYKTFKITEGKKFQSVRSFDFKTGKKESLETDKRLLKIPNQLPGNSIIIVENSIPQKKGYRNLSLLKSAPTKAVFVEDNSLFLVNGDETTELNPLGKGVYVWESLSNDGNRILFTFGTKGAFICDLEGNILSNIDDAHYPKFSPNGKYVSYMKDEDDGDQYTSSDIYVYSLNLGKSFPITNTKDKIEMFAEWSNDGRHLVYHTTNGEIFTTTLQYEN